MTTEAQINVEEFEKKAEKLPPLPGTGAIYLLLAGLSALAFITYLLAGLDGFGYIIVTSATSGWSWFLGAIPFAIAFLIGLLFRRIYAGTTITYPDFQSQGEPPEHRRVRYRIGSMAIDGENRTWIEGGKRATCNKAFMMQSGLFGGWQIAQVVQRQEIGNQVTYEGSSIEASKSLVTNAQLRLLARRAANQQYLLERQ